MEQSCLHSGHEADFIVSQGSIFALIMMIKDDMITYQYIHNDIHGHMVIFVFVHQERIHQGK